MRDIVEILGVNVDRISFDEAEKTVIEYLGGERPKAIYTPNPENIMKAVRDKNYLDILNRADMVVPDGIGVVIASKILKKPVAGRVAGYDLSCKILEYAAKNQTKVYLFGGKEGVAEKASKNLEKKGVNIVGFDHGYHDDTTHIVDEINKTGAELILVCIGAPYQEKWIDANKDKTNAKVFIGAGGSIDVFAGVVKRAPKVYQKLNIEWLYRLLKQPSRFVRMLDLPKFALIVVTKGKRQGE